MAIGLFELIFIIMFGLAVLVILPLFGLTFFNVFRFSNRIARLQESVLDEAERAQRDGQRKTTMDIVSQLPPGSPAHKCRNCGATVDSTAELSADGRVRCNYCNQWTSIYQ